MAVCASAGAATSTPASRVRAIVRRIPTSFFHRRNYSVPAPMRKRGSRVRPNLRASDLDHDADDRTDGEPGEHAEGEERADPAARRIAHVAHRVEDARDQVDDTERDPGLQPGVQGVGEQQRDEEDELGWPEVAGAGTPYFPRPRPTRTPSTMTSTTARTITSVGP